MEAYAGKVLAAEGEHQMASPLYARTVARALEKHLEQCPESSIHWVQSSKEVAWEKPAEIWPTEQRLGYLICDGFSEGMQVHVTAEGSVHDASSHVPVLICKFLFGPKRVFTEAERVRDFIESMDCVDLLSKQAI